MGLYHSKIRDALGSSELSEAFWPRRNPQRPKQQSRYLKFGITTFFPAPSLIHSERCDSVNSYQYTFRNEHNFDQFYNDTTPLKFGNAVSEKDENKMTRTELSTFTRGAWVRKKRRSRGRTLLLCEIAQCVFWISAFIAILSAYLALALNSNTRLAASAEVVFIAALIATSTLFAHAVLKMARSRQSRHAIVVQDSPKSYRYPIQPHMYSSHHVEPVTDPVMIHRPTTAHLSMASTSTYVGSSVGRNSMNPEDVCTLEENRTKELQDTHHYLVKGNSEFDLQVARQAVESDVNIFEGGSAHQSTLIDEGTRAILSKSTYRFPPAYFASRPTPRAEALTTQYGSEPKALARVDGTFSPNVSYSQHSLRSSCF